LTLYEGPNALALLLDDARVAVNSGKRVGLLLEPGDADRDPELAGRCLVHALGPDLSDVARELYAALRELDTAGVDVILARAFPAEQGLGAAIHDRLRRAAAGRIVRR
jgi:L-threonylcarbamoyladenylate synthase